METAASLRTTEPPLRLLRRALGGPSEVAAKAGRLLRTLRLWADRGELERRLDRLEALGWVPRRPTRLQLAFGSHDMLRFVITPAAREYYARQGISFGFHQVLRALDDPCSVIDPTGLFSERESVAGHVMQVVHLNPVYDLQLMEMFPGGLERFEEEVRQMVAGTHPRARTIAAVVEDPGYHERLLAFVRRYREDRKAPPPVREQDGLRRDPHYAAAERTFATLPGFLAYCAALPTGAGALWRRARTRDRFPLEAEIRTPPGS